MRKEEILTIVGEIDNLLKSLELIVEEAKEKQEEFSLIQIF